MAPQTKSLELSDAVAPRLFTKKSCITHKVPRCAKKCMELFAHFLDRLKEARDIDGGRLFDNCIVSYGSNLRSGHELKNVPAILSGGGAEKIKLGKHIVLPGKDRPLANYWLTLMQQAGLPVDEFSHRTGNIPELLS